MKAVSFQIKKIFALLVFAMLLTSCNPTNGSASVLTAPVSRTGFFFDTVITITLYDTGKLPAEDLLDECLARCSYYEDLFSAHREGTDVFRVNDAAGGEVTVSADTAALIEYALECSRLTNGQFDITTGGLSQLWNFTGSPAGPVPGDEAIQEALTHVDYDKIHLYNPTDGCPLFTDSYASFSSASSSVIAPSKDDMTCRVSLTDKETRIDLGALAKGWIADRLKEYLVSQEITSATINLGGNVLLIGSKPDGSDFVVGVQDPNSMDTALIATVSARDVSVVTSGVYERFFEEDGLRYHHILDATTGYPADTGLLGVTIISPYSVQGDALSTVCFLLGEKKGLELVESLDDVEALFITSEGLILRSSGFPKK